MKTSGLLPIFEFLQRETAGPTRQTEGRFFALTRGVDLCWLWFWLWF